MKLNVSPLQGKLLHARDLRQHCGASLLLALHDLAERRIDYHDYLSTDDALPDNQFSFNWSWDLKCASKFVRLSP